MNFLLSKKLVNGFQNSGNEANGAGCLFAQIIAHFKTGVGAAYLTNPHDDDLEDFNYYVDVDDQNLTISVSINDRHFDSISQAIDFIKNQ
jgi:hypothetical protein